MITTAFINIWNRQVGAVAWNTSTGLGSFEYDPRFQEYNWDLAPLKMPLESTAKMIFSFPENKNINTFKGLPGLLADVFPDKYGNAMINAWLARQGRVPDSLNPVELLCLIGKRGMGALEFEPVMEREDTEAGKLELEELIQVAEKILSGKTDFSGILPPKEEKALIDILKIGTSAGGARAKAVIAYNPATGEVRSGQTETPPGFSQWIIKFDGVTDSQFGVSKGYGRVEMAYYQMATDAGITMARCRLLEENKRAHFMTRRFDRPQGKPKVHIQSFCALRHFDFNEINQFSYEQLFETMRMLGLPYPQAEQLFRRLCFNVMGRNCDDHTKNFSFMLEQGDHWKIAPAYDICHAYRPGSDWVSQHALSVNGKRTNIGRKDLVILARKMNIKNPDAIIEQVSQIIKKWPQYAEEVKVESKLKKAIQKTLILL